MSDEAAFLRAICDQPDEDTPRLAFADWLQERGGEFDVAWAELIRVQIALARGADGEQAQRLAARDRELEPLVGSVWQERIGIPGGGHWRNWSRGFPLALRSYGLAPDTGQFEFVPPVPLREVEMTDMRDDELSALVEWPGFRLVRELDIWSNGYIELGLCDLARCEHLGSLERLRMEGVVLTDKAATALLESPHLVGLGYLRLWRCHDSLSERIRRQFNLRFVDWSR